MRDSMDLCITVGYNHFPGAFCSLIFANIITTPHRRAQMKEVFKGWLFTPKLPEVGMSVNFASGWATRPSSSVRVATPPQTALVSLLLAHKLFPWCLFSFCSSSQLCTQYSCEVTEKSSIEKCIYFFIKMNNTLTILIIMSRSESQTNAPLHLLTAHQCQFQHITGACVAK